MVGMEATIAISPAIMLTTTPTSVNTLTFYPSSLSWAGLPILRPNCRQHLVACGVNTRLSRPCRAQQPSW